MSLMVNPIVTEYLNSLEHGLRVAQAERHGSARVACATSPASSSRLMHLRARVGGALIVAGNRLGGQPRLQPVASQS